MTALTFVSIIDDPGRFAKSRNVGAYLGLTLRDLVDHDELRLLLHFFS